MKSMQFIAACVLLICMHTGYAQDVTGVVTHESTNNANDGAIDITVNAGFPPFAFSWSGPGGFTSTNEDISGLAPGLYCVTVTDAVCGTVTFCGIVRRCNPILGSSTAVLCPYNSNGTFSILVGGQGPFQVEWSDGVVNANETGPVVRRTDLNLGVYCVTVTNGYGCSETVCRTINTSVQPIQINGNVQQPSCGMSSGSILIAVTGGYAPYSYLWSDNAQTKDRANLSPGDYTVTVSDNKACTQTASFTVTPFANNMNIYIKNLAMISDCRIPNIVCDGAIDIEVSGGTGQYFYNWSGPGFSSGQQDINGLCVMGEYSVTVTDNAGCSQVEKIEICCCDNFSEPGNPVAGACIFESLQVSGSVSPASSSQGGSINLAVFGYGGLNDYSIVWKKDGQFFSYQKNLTNLQPGTYCATVSNGCASTTKCFTIINCDLVSIAVAGISEPACQGYPEGNIKLTSINGGIPPYTYKWSNGSTNKNLGGLTAGNYTVTVSDKNGCTTEKTFTVNTAPITVQDVECSRITYCGNQIVKIQQFDPSWQFNPADCREARIVCANGYVGPWEHLGTTLEYVNGPTSCQILARCMNGQIYTIYYGQTLTKYVGGISNCTGYCLLVSYCYYPDLDGYDPNSVQVIGNGSVSYEPSGQTNNCSCSPYNCCIKYDTYCNGNYIGISEDPCPPVTPGNPGENAYYSLSDKEKEAVLKSIELQHPDYARIDLDNPAGNLMSRTSNGNNENFDIYANGALPYIAEVFPNPFKNLVTIKVFVNRDQPVNLSLLDINGRLIKGQGFDAKGGVNTFEFSIENYNYPTGLYIIRLTDNAGNITNNLLLKSE